MLDPLSQGHACLQPQRLCIDQPANLVLLEKPQAKALPAFEALVRYHALLERLQLLYEGHVLLSVLLEPDLLQPGYR